jgi:hypothetical protein
MARSSLTIEQILTILTETPSRIAKLTDGLTVAQLRTPPGQDEWSANDVLAHLRACADVWGHCISAILSQDRPTLRAIDPRTWIKTTNYPELDFQSSFQAFTTQRTELQTVLKSLERESWSRGATVTGAGKPLERTVLFYAQWLARHERTHVKQIEKIADAVRVE